MENFIKSLESEVEATKVARSEIYISTNKSNSAFRHAVKTAHEVVSSTIAVPPNKTTKLINAGNIPAKIVDRDTNQPKPDYHVHFDTSDIKTIFRFEDLNTDTDIGN